MARFEKNEVIKHKDKMYQCIVCDEELAVFGKIEVEEGTSKINPDQPLILNQKNIYDGFEYAKVDSTPPPDVEEPKKKGRK